MAERGPIENPRILITRPLPGDPVARLAAAGYEDVHTNPLDERMERQALLEAAAGCHAVIDTPADVDINAEFFDAAGEQLVIISNYAVGVDNVDLEEAARRGVVVGHTPGPTTEPTADVAILLLLAAAKRASEGERMVRSGKWPGVGPKQLLGVRVTGKTLLIVGAGRIGLATARRAVGFDLRLLYVARSDHPEFEHAPINARRISLEEGLAQADFVSVHTPLSAETYHLINAERLAMMKPTAVLINTSRGATVDEAALVEALREKRIAAAGLDVFENEPRLHPGLAELDNTFLLPHLGTATVEDRTEMMEIAVDNVIAAMQGRPLLHEFVQ